MLKKFVSGLCLSLALLLTASAVAQETAAMKPFLTLKFADPATLVSVAEKVADLAGKRREFDAGFASFRELGGINKTGPFGLILQSDGEAIQMPVVVLPIESFGALSFPNVEALLANAEKDGDKLIFGSPLGDIVAHQRKGFVLVTPSASAAPLPEDPIKLFTGLEKYTVGFRADFENTTLESIETFTAPLSLMMSMRGAEGAKAAEQFGTVVNLLHKEYKSISGGLVFDPKTAALDYVVTVTPKKGSAVEKQLAALKDMKTALSGFTSMAPDAIFSVNGSQNGVPQDDEQVAMAMTTIDQAIDGFLEQFADQAETDKEFEQAEIAAKAFCNVIEASMKKGSSDLGISMNANGTILIAAEVGDTQELKKANQAIVNMLQARGARGEEAAAALEKYWKKDFETVNDFKLTSLIIPLAELAEASLPSTLADKTLTFFSGIKDGEAFALAVGLDAKEVEAKFRAALAKTGEPVVATQQPIGFFALQPLGKLFDKYIPEENRDGTAEKIIKLLADAPSDAKITLSARAVDDSMEVKYGVSGSTVTTIAELIKIAVAAKVEADEASSVIREF